MSNEPILTKPNGSPEGGRPEIADEQYQKWLDDLAPYLKLASTLYYASEKAGLEKHYWVIMKKYRLNDWFAQKVDAYRREIGEITNNATVRLMRRIEEKSKQELPLSKDELDFMKWFSEKHRTAQPFFVTRTEQVVKDDKEVGKILDVLEDTKTDYGTIGREAKKQVVAVDAPIQNKEQAGGDSHVQAELPPVATPSGTGSTQV